MNSKPVIEKIEDDLRRDIIASFKKWLDRPDTKIEGVERFWEYKIRLLLAEISCLSAEKKKPRRCNRAVYKRHRLDVQ